jgi:hypothetical protein
VQQAANPAGPFTFSVPERQSPHTTRSTVRRNNLVGFDPALRQVSPSLDPPFSASPNSET